MKVAFISFCFVLLIVVVTSCSTTPQVKDVKEPIPKTVETLTRTDIDNTIIRNLIIIRDCYENELNKNPESSGKVVLEFTILGNGDVKDLKIKSTTFEEMTVPKCVAREARRLKYPKAKDNKEMLVTYPLVFKNSLD